MQFSQTMYPSRRKRSVQLHRHAWNQTHHLSPSRANHISCNHYKEFFGKRSNSRDFERDYTLYEHPNKYSPKNALSPRTRKLRFKIEQNAYVSSGFN